MSSKSMTRKSKSIRTPMSTPTNEVRRGNGDDTMSQIFGGVKSPLSP